MNVFITGSSHGLGLALAERYVLSGCPMILHGRDELALNEAYHKIGALGMVIGDLADDSTLDRIIIACQRWDVDILVNNAGTIDQSDPARLIATNLVAPIILARAVYETVMRPRGSGMIVNINSLAGKTFSDAQAVYCASKWGLRGFTGSFRYEARQHGVQVMDVYPGAIKTAMTADRPGWDKFVDPDEAAAFIVAETLDHKGASFAVNEIEIGRAQG